MKTLSFVLLVVVTAASTAAVKRSVASDTPVPAAAEHSREDLARQKALARSRGLGPAAGVTGAYVETVRIPTLGAPASWSELSALSSLIVVGTAISNVGALRPDGRLVLSMYDVRVERVLKGTVPGQELRILLPGGRFGFADGSWAQTNVRNFVRPSNGQTAVWFLRDAPSPERPEGATGALYVTAAGPLGLYVLDRGNRRAQHILPAGGFETPLGKKVHAARLSRGDFVREIASEIR